MATEIQNASSEGALSQLRSGKVFHTYNDNKQMTLSTEQLEQSLDLANSQEYRINGESVWDNSEHVVADEVIHSGADFHTEIVNAETDSIGNPQLNSTFEVEKIQDENGRTTLVFHRERKGDAMPRKSDRKIQAEGLDVISEESESDVEILKGTTNDKGNLNTPSIGNHDEEQQKKEDKKEESEEMEVSLKEVLTDKEEKKENKQAEKGKENEEEEDPPSEEMAKFIKEIRKALKPDLDSIRGLLLDPKDDKKGLIPSVSAMKETLYNKEDGVCAKVNKMQNTLYKGETAVTVRLGALEGKVKGKTTGLLTRVSALEKMRDEPEEGFIAVALRVTSLEGDVNGKEGLTNKVESLSTTVKTIEEKLVINPTGPIVLQTSKRKSDEMLEEEVADQRKRLDVASNMIHVMSKELSHLKTQTTANAAKHMANELVMGGIRMEDAEDPIEATIRFIQHRLQIEVKQDEIHDAFRSDFTTKKQIQGRTIIIPPVMFVKTTESVRRKILRNTWKLTDIKQQPEGYGMYIRQSLPECFRDARRRFSTYTNKIRAKNAQKKEGEYKTQFWFSGEKFFVEGNMISENIAKPTPHDMLFISKETQALMDTIDFCKSHMIEEQGSKFQAYGVEVTDLDTINLAFKKIKQLEGKADHIMLAYRIVKEEGKIMQGSVHDGEYFGDLEVLETMKRKEKADIAVFVVREYGGIHLGKKRFQIIQDVAVEVIDKMKGKFVQLIEKDPDIPGPKKASYQQRSEQFNNRSGQKNRDEYRDRDRGNYNPNKDYQYGRSHNTGYNSGKQGHGGGYGRGGYRGSYGGSGGGRGNYPSYRDKVRGRGRDDYSW